MRVKTFFRKLAAGALEVLGALGILVLVIKQLSKQPLNPPILPLVLFVVCLVVIFVGWRWYRKPEPEILVLVREDQLKKIKTLSKAIHQRFGTNKNTWDNLLVLGNSNSITCDGYTVSVEYARRYHLVYYAKRWKTGSIDMKAGTVIFMYWPEGRDAPLEEFQATNIIHQLEHVTLLMNKPTMPNLTD